MAAARALDGCANTRPGQASITRRRSTTPCPLEKAGQYGPPDLVRLTRPSLRQHPPQPRPASGDAVGRRAAVTMTNPHQGIGVEGPYPGEQMKRWRADPATVGHPTMHADDQFSATRPPTPRTPPAKSTSRPPRAPAAARLRSGSSFGSSSRSSASVDRCRFAVGHRR